MPAKFVSVPIPSSGVGAAIDISDIGAQKTLVVDGPATTTGIVQVEGSQDGVNFCPITKFAADNPSEESIVMVLQSIRCRRLSGSGTSDLAVGGQEVTSNQFSILDENPIDTSGLGTEKTIIVTGEYEAAPIVIEGSNDDVNYDVIGQFDTLGSQIVHVSGDYKSMRLREATTVTVLMGSGYLFESASGPPVGAVENIVEDVQNQSGGPMGTGDIVRLVGDNGIAPADGSTTALAAGTIGILTQNLNDGDTGVIVTAGKTQVALASSVASVVAGDLLWLSDEELARATNVQPGRNNVFIGTVKDASGYEPGGFVSADILIEKIVVGMRNRVVIGEDAFSALNSIALGSTAFAGNDGGIALGNGSNASDGSPGIVVGTNASVGNAAPDEGHIAIGQFSQVIDDEGGPSGVALGYNAKALPKSVAIGGAADAGFTDNDNDAIAIGWTSVAGGGSIAIGSAANAENTGTASIAIGEGTVSQSGSVVIKSTTTTNSPNAVVIGGAAQNASDAIAIKGTATTTDAIAIGKDAQAQSAGLAIGTNAIVSNNGHIAIGNGAQSNGDGTLCIGNGAITASESCVVIGRQATAGDHNATAVGAEADSAGNSGVAIGALSNVTGFAGIAIGRDASSTATEAIAIGYTAQASIASAIAIGDNAIANGESSIAIGTSVNVTHANSIAIGNDAASTAANQFSVGSVAAPISEILFRGVGALSDPLRAIAAPASGDTGLFIQFNDGAITTVKTVRAGAGGTGPGGVGRALYIDT